MNVFELFATLGLDTSSYDESLDSAEQRGSSFGSNIGNVVAGGARIGAAAIAATATAAIGLTSAFAEGITETAAMGDAIDKNSQKMGMSVESYIAWDQVMQHCGTSIETMKTGMKTLASAVETGNEAFERIGLSQEQLAEMSQEEIFEATIAGLQGIEDTSERTYLASQLLGRGATELGALLNMTTEETAEMKARVSELGGVMSSDAVKDAAAYTDSMQDLGTAFTSLKNGLLSEFLPSITTVMDGLTEIMIGNDEEGLGMIDQGVNDFIENLNSVVPRLLEIGGRIITSLITAISSNLPSLLSEGSNVLSEIIQGIIIALPYLVESAMMIIEQIASALFDNSDLLINTALQILMVLVNGLTKNAPVVIPAIIQVISQIVKTLTQPDVLSGLIQAALSIILAIGEGLLQATPDLIMLIPMIIVNLCQALIDNAPLVLDTILQLIGMIALSIFSALATLMGSSLEEVGQGLEYGFQLLSEWGAGVIEWFTGIGTSIKDGVTSFFTNVGNFFSNGIENIKTKVRDGLDAVKQKFTDIFEGAKTIVSNALEFIKGLFKFEWKLPELKLPHFSISGDFNLDPMNFSMPKISVEWYQKAMSTPYLLDDATIFGASAGKLLGAGESGQEVVYGRDQLMRDIGAAVQSGMGSMQLVANIYVGGKKIDQQIVTANARNAVISGGR